MTDDLFDAAAMYDDDYLHFFASPDATAPTHGPLVGTAHRGPARTADLVWRLLGLAPGTRVLDVGCGHGARVLRPGGRLIMDLDNAVSFLRAYTPSRITARRANGDLLADLNHLDPLTGRFTAERTLTFVKRIFGFPGLRDRCAAAGFEQISGYGEDGTALHADHPRTIVVAEAR